MKIGIVCCKNCKYFKRDKVYVLEGLCKFDGKNDYTREHRCCHKLDTDEKRREAKLILKPKK